jgi:hypothetical protein
MLSLVSGADIILGYFYSPGNNIHNGQSRAEKTHKREQKREIDAPSPARSRSTPHARPAALCLRTE